MKVEKDQIIDWTKEYIDEFIGGVCVLILVFLMILLKRQYIIASIGAVVILALAFEKRAKVFDKTVSILVVFCVAVGFMLID